MLLALAVDEDRDDIVKLLINQNDVDVNTCDEEGIACTKGNKIKIRTIRMRILTSRIGNEGISPLNNTFWLMAEKTYH